MLIKLCQGENDNYLYPIFSDFEKEYLITEIDMIISNGGNYIEFDNFKSDRIFVYTDGYYVGDCVGELAKVLWELLNLRIIIDGTDMESYLDFARVCGSMDNHSGHITLRYDLQKIKQRIFDEKFDYTLGYKRHTDGIISKEFKESIDNYNMNHLKFIRNFKKHLDDIDD